MKRDGDSHATANRAVPRGISPDSHSERKTQQQPPMVAHDPLMPTTQHGEEIASQQDVGGGHLLLHDADDKTVLTPILCLVRSQIEIFVATPADVEARTHTGANKRPISVGQVGIRCIHCANKQFMDQSKGSTSYPASIRLMHQAVRNWQRFHMPTCSFIPADVKETYLRLKAQNSKSTKTSVKYWVDSCRRKGLADTDETNGIRLVGDTLSKPVLSPSTLPSIKLASKPGPKERFTDNNTPSDPNSKFVNASRRKDSTLTSGNKESNKLLLLEKVKLALGIVEAIREIRCLQPASAENEGNSKRAELPGFVGTKHELRTLGVELYELFAGYPPICGNDNKGILGINEEDFSSLSITQASKKQREKCLENKHYTSLREGGLPVCLSNVVSNLLDENKTAALQYDSVCDVEEDLRLMATQPALFLFDEESGADIGQLKLPSDKLYDRDKHITVLLEAFNRVAMPNSPCEMVLVSGYSGAGKSRLLLEAQSLISSNGGSFMSGKFDKLRQVQPLSAIVSALNEHCGNLLIKDAEYLQVTRAAIEDALGPDVQVITDLIPNLCQVIGEPKQVPTPVGGKEAHFRLMYCLRTFLSVTTGPTNPTVFVLDDMQWADEASLELFHFLATDPQTTNVLFIGSYRENEVGTDHPVTKHLLNIEASGVALTSIHVGDMCKESVNCLISETLHFLPRLTLPLTDVVYRNTKGNALFVNQFLTSLCDEGLLCYSLAKHQWEWDMDAICAKDVADNVVDLMMRKMLKLPRNAQRALTIAACLGTRFPTLLLRLLEAEEEFESIGIVNTLETHAVGKGLMCKFGPVYKFSHDQIRCAAYNLTPEFDREALHLQVGRTLWKRASTEELESIIFEVVNQLHQGQGLINDHAEEIEYVQLILKAGKKAISSFAFMSALSYLTIGKSLLTDSDWEHHYELCANTFNSCAEAEYILGQISGGTLLSLKEVIDHSRLFEDQLRAKITLIRSLTTMGNLNGAVHLSLECLDQVGEPMPSVFDDNTCRAGSTDTENRLKDITDDGILNLSEMKDKKKITAMKLLSLLVPITYMGVSPLQHLVAFRMVHLSLSHGVCSESAVAFSCYGLFLCGVMGDYMRGYQYGKLGLALLDRFQILKCASQVRCIVYGAISCFLEPLQATFQPLLDGHRIGLSMGSTYQSFSCAFLYVTSALYSGRPLEQLLKEIQAFLQQMIDYKQHTAYFSMKALHRAVLSLSTSSCDIEQTENNGDTGEGVPSLVKVLAYILQSWLAYLFGEYDLAAAMAKKRSEQTRSAGEFGHVRNYTYALFTFNTGLTTLALAREGKENHWKNVVGDSIKKMEVLAQSSPWNFQHKLDLLNAEYWSLIGDTSAAAKAYEQSIALSGEHHFINEQALAFERAGTFYLHNGKRTQAIDYFTRSHQCYSQWGAHRKADKILDQLKII